MTFEMTPWRRGRGLRPWRESGDFWDDFFRDMPLSESRFGWAPSVDVSESDGSVVVKAELPGMESKDIEVDLTGNILTIKGEKKVEEEKKEEERVYCRERFYGTFQRSFRLPAGVESDKVEANFKNGVLTVSVPKSEESKHRKIEIKSA